MSITLDRPLSPVRPVAAAGRPAPFRAPEAPRPSAPPADRSVSVTLTVSLPSGTADVEAARLADALRSHAQQLTSGRRAQTRVEVASPHPFTQTGGSPARILPPGDRRSAASPARERRGVVSATSPARRDIEAARRRAQQARAVSPASASLPGDASLVLDLYGRRLRIDGADVELTYKEFELLAHLARHARRIVGREELMESVWADAPAETGERTVDVHVRRVRSKLGRYRRLISTVRGAGYRLDPGSDVSLLG